MPSKRTDGERPGQPAEERLTKYRAKRDFKSSPEPANARPKRVSRKKQPIFCVQKHLASHLHYDFRLEHAGVLLSWAVPKGPSLNPADKRLAMHVEDHPLDYADFEGVIPEGYGAGIVMLWDTGTWEIENGDVAKAMEKGELKFCLHGTKLKGSWVLVRTGRDGRSWLLIKHRDDWAGDVDVTEAAPNSIKSFGDFADILAQEKPEIWESHMPAKGGAAGQMLREIVEQAAQRIAEREQSKGSRKTARRTPRKGRAASGKSDNRLSSSACHLNRPQPPPLDGALRASAWRAPCVMQRPRCRHAHSKSSRRFPDVDRADARHAGAQAAGTPELWTAEFKWDGVRALTFWDGATLRIRSRNDLPIEHRYPELHAIAKALGKHRVVLDGEIIAIDEHGSPSFPLLQRRMLIEGGEKIARLSKSIPICYMVFDVLHLDGTSTIDLPYTGRRELLDRLKLASPSWAVSPAKAGDMDATYEAAREQDLEGIVAKLNSSVYEPGRRGRNWLKLKLVQRQEFVVGGWVPEGGTNVKRVGAIMVGYYDKAGTKLVYAGAVGTGFDARWHELLTGKLAPLAQKENPFAGQPRKEGARFVRPELVVEIEYRRWPSHTGIQQAAFKGLRLDKPARKVVDERVPRQ